MHGKQVHTYTFVGVSSGILRALRTLVNILQAMMLLSGMLRIVMHEHCSLNCSTRWRKDQNDSYCIKSLAATREF